MRNQPSIFYVLYSDPDLVYHHPIFRPKEKPQSSRISASLPNDSQDDEIMHLGMIMKNAGSSSAKASRLKMQFVVLFNSILEQRSKIITEQKQQAKRIHLTILTDQKSVGPLLR